MSKEEFERWCAEEEARLDAEYQFVPLELRARDEEQLKKWITVDSFYSPYCLINV